MCTECFVISSALLGPPLASLTLRFRELDSRACVESLELVEGVEDSRWDLWLTGVDGCG